MLFLFFLSVLLAFQPFTSPACSQDAVLPVSPLGAWIDAADTEKDAGTTVFLGAEVVENVWAYALSSDSAGFSPKMSLAFLSDSSMLDLVARLSLNTDEKYGPSLVDVPDGGIGSVYFLMEEGGVRFHNGSVKMAAGRFRHYDVVGTPYSLFINSSGIAATIMSFAYDNGFFFYETRWIGLNHDSTMTTDAWGVGGVGNEYTGSGFPDRGANVKVMGLRLSNGMRIGFQDAATYSLRYFDPEYFFNPIPQYFIQYGMSTGGQPWATELDDGNMIGAFWDWKYDENFSFLAQVLMDDLNIGGLFGTTMNPNQMAFSLGSHVRTRYGDFGFFAAGATKFTFEPAPVGGNPLQQAMVAYGYTYYPDTRFDYDRMTTGFQPSALNIEDNAIGYVYGENNLAFRADWKKSVREFDLSAALEFRLMGDNSPANAWHDGVDNPLVPVRWLDSAVLEKRILGGFTVSTRRGDWRYHGSVTAGVAFDALELRAPNPPSGTYSLADTAIWIYSPVAGNTKPILKFALGSQYAWRL